MKPILQHANRKSSISITVDVNKIEYSNIVLWRSEMSLWFNNLFFSWFKSSERLDLFVNCD